jgi:hypothetical protein
MRINYQGCTKAKQYNQYTLKQKDTISLILVNVWPNDHHMHSYFLTDFDIDQIEGSNMSMIVVSDKLRQASNYILRPQGDDSPCYVVIDSSRQFAVINKLPPL